MPIYKKHIINEEAELAVWQVTEPEAFFAGQLGFSSEHKNEMRRLEHLAGRFLLKYIKAEFPLHKIELGRQGKPLLPTGENLHFSISHSYPYVAAIVAKEKQGGIDIQVFRDKIIRLQHKFLSEYEQQLCEHETEQLTLAWCVKEAVYKWYGHGKVDFIQHIHIMEMDKKPDNNHYKITVQFEVVDTAIISDKMTLYLQGLIDEEFAMAWLLH